MQGKIAIVTGASRGIGRACAIALASAGAKVVLAALRLRTLPVTKAKLERSSLIAKSSMFTNPDIPQKLASVIPLPTEFSAAVTWLPAGLPSARRCR